MNPSSSPQPAPARVHTLLAVLTALLWWVSRWHFSEVSAAPVLDPSYMQALGRALVEGLQFGRDVRFTYGPLGWFNMSPYEPALFWVQALAFELLFKSLCAYCVFDAARALRSVPAILLFAVAACIPPMGYDAIAFFAIVAATRFALTRSASSPWSSVLPALTIATWALVKFTYFSLAIGCAALIVLACFARGWKRAAWAGALLASCFAALWLVTGQSLANITSWVASSAELASAFSTAMSIEPEPREIGAAYVVLALVVASCALAWRFADRSERFQVVAVLLGTFVAYKAGFTRATGNEITFFGYAGAALFLVPLGANVRTRFPACLRAVAVVAALGGYCLVADDHGASPWKLTRSWGQALATNVSTLASLGEHRRHLESERALLSAKYDVPRVRAAIGTDTVDVFATEQGLVFLNDLAWHPRPVFQSYSVFTDALSRGNARFLESSAAPRFMIFRGGATDGRLPTSEDAHSLHILLRDYRPRLVERGMLLFERRTDAPRADLTQPEVVLERDWTVGSELDLEPHWNAGDVLRLEIELAPTLLGRVRTLFARASALECEVVLSNGSLSRHRVVPELTRGGFFVSPWLATEDDWMSWILGDPTQHVSKLRIVEGASGWSEHAHVRLTRANDLAPSDARYLEHEIELRFSMFKTLPSSFSRAPLPSRTTVRGMRELCVAHPPSTLRFDLAPGRYRLRGEFGFVPDAHRLGDTDGAELGVWRARTDATASAPLFTRYLDPEREPRDGLMQTLDIELELAAGEWIELRTASGPEGNTNRDWVFWTGVEFSPL